MTATNKKLHWTQTSKGKKKLSKQMKEKWEKRGRVIVPPPSSPFAEKQLIPKNLSHIEALQHLMKEVDARLLQIETEVNTLLEEANQLKRAFKGQQEPEQFPANGDQ